jgi:hypothetical protein
MYQEGISFFAASETVIFSNLEDSKKIVSLPDVPPNYQLSPWSHWGDDNDAPVQMMEDIKNTPVLSGGIHTKTRMAIGKGIAPYLKVGGDIKTGEENLEAITDSEITDWCEINKSYEYCYKSIYNYGAYGWGATQFMLNMKRDYINRIKAPDIATCRLEKKNPKNGVIENLYMCSNWMGKLTFNSEWIRKVPVLEEDYELADLQHRRSGYEFAMLHRLLTDGFQYYPAALWQSANLWVKISRSIPLIKEAIHKNQMSVKYVVLIHDKYWPRNYKNWGKLIDAEREKIVSDKHQQINNWLTGQQNAGKTIVSSKYIDEMTKETVAEIEVIVLDDKWKDGKMLPDNAAADKQICFAMLFNPAICGANLLGDGASGGAGSGSDIRESFLVMLMLMETERQMNNNVFNLVKRFNKWTRLESPGKQLVFRYDTSILTTLDTGGSLQNKKA